MRKIIQLAKRGVVLCDDGTIWKSNEIPGGKTEWYEVDTSFMRPKKQSFEEWWTEGPPSKNPDYKFLAKDAWDTAKRIYE